MLVFRRRPFPVATERVTAFRTWAEPPDGVVVAAHPGEWIVRHDDGRLLGVLSEEAFREHFEPAPAAPAPASEAVPFRTLREVRAAQIEATLVAVDGNKRRAARLLGISRSALYAHLARGAAPAARVAGP